MQPAFSIVGAVGLTAVALWLIRGPDASPPLPEPLAIDTIDPSARAQAAAYGHMARLMELQGACVAARLARQQSTTCDELAALQQTLAASAADEPPLDTGLPGFGQAMDRPAVQREDAQ